VGTGRRRYAVAGAASLAAAAAFTAVAARRLGDRVLTLPNALTLTRAGAAAMLCGTAFSGRGRRPGLWGLVAGCTVVDWLDGPLARRLGATRLGALLDIESDSWLTLWGAVAAHRLGGLPGWCLLPPALRYPLAAGRPGPLRPWQRAVGVAQMVIIAGALTRWRPPRRLALAVAAAQLASLGAGALVEDGGRARPWDDAPPSGPNDTAADPEQHRPPP